MKLSTLQRKKFRVRNKLKNNSKNDRYRLSVSRSLKNISAQIIDDNANKTIVSASSNEKKMRENKTDQKPDNILQRGVLLSSGMIAGESLMGILLAFLAGAGIQSLNLGIDPNLVTALTMLAALGTIWWLYKSSK